MTVIGAEPAQPTLASGWLRRFGIRAKLMLAVLAVAVITLLTGAVSWNTYARIESLLNGITRDTYPGVTIALKLAESTSRLAALAGALESARTQLQRQAGYTGLRQQIGLIKTRLPDLGQALIGHRSVSNLQDQVEQLVHSLDQMNQQVARRLTLENDRRKMQDRLAAAVAEYRGVLTPALTNEAAIAPAVPWPLVNLAIGGLTLSVTAGEAASVADPDRLTELRRRFGTEAAALADAMELFREGTPEASRLVHLVDTLCALGSGAGSGNLFDLRAEELAVRGEILASGRTTRDLVARIATSVEPLTAQAEAQALRMNAAAAEQLDHGRLQIILIALVALVGPGLFLWLYLNRSVFGRLSALAEDTRGVASGNLTARIRRTGHDEITEMADALLAFRNAVIELRATTQARVVSDERLDMALTVTRTAVWDTDPVTGNTWWSPQYWRLLGYKETEIRASLQQWVALIHPEDLATVLKANDDPDATDADEIRAHYRMRHKDGRWIWVEDVGRIFRGPDRRPGRRVGIKMDITERRMAEEALKRAKDEAEDALAKLRDAQETLVQSEKLAALGSLVAGVAHEINTPIGITLTAASFLQDETEKLKTLVDENRLRRTDVNQYVDQALEGAKLIQVNTMRAADLVQSFKQVAVDQIGGARRSFELKTYIEEVLMSVGPRLKTSRHKVTLDCPAGIVLDGYPGALSQVLTNLIMNALIHAYDDGQCGTMAIVVVQSSSDWVEVRFSDDGKGIPAEYQPKIFEPFFTTKRDSGGSGLGLHIVYNIITVRLGGLVNVDSSPGLGTTFTLRIPLTAPNTDS